MLSLRDKVMAESLDTQDLVTLDDLAISKTSTPSVPDPSPTNLSL